MPEYSILSGIKSKHITLVIRPAAISKIKLTNLFELISKKAPIMPPKVVPIIPNIKPKIPISAIPFIKNPSQNLLILIYLKIFIITMLIINLLKINLMIFSYKLY